MKTIDLAGGGQVFLSLPVFEGYGVAVELRVDGVMSEAGLFDSAQVSIGKRELRQLAAALLAVMAEIEYQEAQA